MTQPALLTPRYLLLACDRIVTGSILFLIVFTPLAFGSVHPWAFSLMEAVVFLLVIVWVGKLLFSSYSSTLSPLRSLALPLALFVSLLLFQLLPLPPSLLRFLSPATYELYTQSLPGWPEKTPYNELVSQSAPSDSRLEAQIEAQNSQFQTPDSRLQTLDSSSGVWCPLSIAPSLTHTDILQFLAYASLFSLLLLYPFGNSQGASGPPHKQDNAEERFLRLVLLTVLSSGLFVACIGLVQQLTWNGKILWFFVPYDWEGPHPEGIPRASGPFVNPDHFANYLALIFPLALVGTLSPRFLVSQERGKAFRRFCGFTVLVLLMGMLLSLSRGGWTSTTVGVGILLGILLSLPEETRPSLFRSTEPAMRVSLIGLVLLLVLALFFVGPSGRSQIDVRLEQTVTLDEGLWVRTSAWKDSMGMIRDFPLFGVGLGAWPELFPRYQRPPWSPSFYNAAHNDYLELLADTGLIGFGLLAWFFWQGGRRLYHGLWTVPPRTVSVCAALVAALGIMAFHECFDFNLQISANAFLFTLFLGIALRLVGSGVRGQRSEVRGQFHVSVAVGTGVVALLLFILALKQENLPYPYNLKEPASLAEAREMLLSHPAFSSLHLSLFSLLEHSAAPSELLKELEIALWLDPGDPDVRDLYATSLLQQGREEEGLKEMTQSVFFAPSLSAHAYLDRQRIPQLSATEQRAVEAGFQQALAFGSEEAVSGLGAFCAALGRSSDEGKLYEAVALRKEEPKTKSSYLLGAALAYARAGEQEKAEALLRQAALVTPKNPDPYHYLANWIFVPQKKLDLAKAVIAEGIQKGADPFSLSLSLAEAAQAVGDKEEAKAALLQALAFQPSSLEAHMRLGLLYLQERNFDRAVLSLRKATELNPNSASAFYHLGVAEEGRYQFFAAEKAYARAVKLAPDDTGFQRQYEALQRKVAEDGRQEG